MPPAMGAFLTKFVEELSLDRRHAVCPDIEAPDTKACEGIDGGELVAGFVARLSQVTPDPEDVRDYRESYAETPGKMPPPNTAKPCALGSPAVTWALNDVAQRKPSRFGNWAEAKNSSRQRKAGGGGLVTVSTRPM